MKMVLDIMLGRLAKWLRFLGYDTELKEIKTEEVLEQLLGQDYVCITRRRQFKKYQDKYTVYFLQSNDVWGQLQELILRLPLKFNPELVGSRCILCNCLLEPRSKEEIWGQVPDYIWNTQTTFKQCPKCHRIYWPGSHHQRTLERLKDLFKSARNALTFCEDGFFQDR